MNCIIVLWVQAQEPQFHDRYKKRNLSFSERAVDNLLLSILQRTACLKSTSLDQFFSESLLISPPDNTHFPLFMIDSLSIIIYGALIVLAGRSWLFGLRYGWKVVFFSVRPWAENCLNLCMMEIKTLYRLPVSY